MSDYQSELMATFFLCLVRMVWIDTGKFLYDSCVCAGEEEEKKERRCRRRVLLRHWLLLG